MRELLQSEARFREIVGSAMDAIVVFDADGNISLVNGAAERMFGATTTEAIGSSITRFFPDGVGSVDQQVQDLPAGGLCDDFERGWHADS